MPNLVDEYETIFLGKQDKPWNSSKIFFLYWSDLSICFEVRQTLKSDLLGHGILVQDFRIPNLVDEYKTIFLESQTKLQTLQKLSPYIGGCYKFVLKSVKTLNRIFLAMENWFKSLECQVWWTNTNHFSGKVRQSFKLSKIFLLILGLPINLFWSVREISVDCDSRFSKCCKCWILNCEIFNWR